MRLLEFPLFPPHDGGELDRAPPRGSGALDELAGVWVDDENNVMHVAGGWAFGVEGGSDENVGTGGGGVFELELEQPPPPSSGEGVGDGGGRRVVKMKDKNWTLDDDASNSSTRLV